MRGEDLIVAEQEGRRFATTSDVLAEENRMVGFARQGRGACQQLADPPQAFARDWLNDGHARL